MNKEQIAILYSIFGAVIMTALGGGFAFLTGSDAILLDTLFNVITLIMSLLTLKVAQLLKNKPSGKHQFDYNKLAPLLNMSKGVIILVLCLIAGIDSVLVVLSGGKSLNMGLASIYAVLSTFICFSTALILRHYKNQLHSSLVDLEAFNWLINGLISAGVAMTFILGFFLESTNWRFVVPYIDPVIVIVLISLVIKVPYQVIRDNLNQLKGSSAIP